MAIQLKLRKTERILFCGSKWWGDPDMPQEMQYPSVRVNEDGETYDYPLTFICQINCEDIAAFDKENLLPHEGMLYFFGAIDTFLGYGSPIEILKGEWPKGHMVVKYAKEINFEAFQSRILVDDEGNSLTEPELEIIFSECDDDSPECRILGKSARQDESCDGSEQINLFRIKDNDGIGLELPDSCDLEVMIKASDLRFRNWKKIRTYLR